MKRWLILVCLLAAPLFGADLNFDEISRVVIQSGGRKKPLDTFASEALLTITGRKAVRDPETGARLAPMDTALSMWLGTRKWADAPIILVSPASLKQALGLPSTERLFSFNSLIDNQALRDLIKKAEAKRARDEERLPLEKDAESVLVRMELMHTLLSGEAFAVVPDPQSANGKWHLLQNTAMVHGPENSTRLASIFERVAGAYRKRNADGFQAACVELRGALAGLAPGIYPAASQIDREVHYNRMHPFRWAWILYGVAFFVLMVPKWEKAGAGLFALGLAAHIYGLVLRCLIAGRPPVTNMYESVIWVSLGASAFALLFASIYRARIYLLAAAPLAVLGLILADSFPSVLNPSIAPLPPVLRDNFWLVVHVLTITLSYAAFAVAMGLGHAILGRYLFKPSSIGEESPIHHLLYRVLQIGIVLLAAGTILGGVWANYSWGRFWGWDPKETWALIALLLYIFALHGKLTGWWGNFGMAVAAAVCFNGVLMAWYGVNFVLGKGLHSYGFGGGGAAWVGIAVALDMIFVGACITARLRSVRRSPAAVAT